MGIVLSKKKQYLLLLLIILVISGLVAGILLLFEPFTNSNPRFNKYQDLATWCDTSKTDNTLDIVCKGLLLDIRNLEDSSNCFDVKVITKNKELKDLSVCENGDTLSYTNEILEYKKLMPIDMIFTYSKEGITNSYSFSSVSLTKLDDTYVQGIVNEDIANLVTIDPSSTTIQNSVDFCPKPETLSDYITEENKTKYAAFYSNNILGEQEYENGYLYGWDDNVVRTLFACDSAENMGYAGICDRTIIKNFSLISQNINPVNLAIKSQNEFDEDDFSIVKEVSLIYDSMYKVKPSNNIVNLGLLGNLLAQINNKDYVNQEVICGLYKIYSGVATQGSRYSVHKDTLEEIFLKNSLTCSGELPNWDLIYNRNGVYIEKYLSTPVSNIQLYSRCKNLTNVVNY